MACAFLQSCALDAKHSCNFTVCTASASHHIRPACGFVSNHSAPLHHSVPGPQRLCPGAISLTQTNPTRQVVCSIGAVMNLSGPAFQSVDPLSRLPQDPNWTQGKAFTIHSPTELDSLLEEHKEKLVVLMCKASHCRPCKMFARKYSRIAERFKDCVLLDVLGDETMETRKLMMDMEVKVTPTFRMYRNGEVCGVITGTSENKLIRAISEKLLPGEVGGSMSSVDADDDE